MLLELTNKVLNISSDGQLHFDLSSVKVFITALFSFNVNSIFLSEAS